MSEEAFAVQFENEPTDEIGLKIYNSLCPHCEKPIGMEQFTLQGTDAVHWECLKKAAEESDDNVD